MHLHMLFIKYAMFQGNPLKTVLSYLLHKLRRETNQLYADPLASPSNFVCRKYEDFLSHMFDWKYPVNRGCSENVIPFTNGKHL